MTALAGPVLAFDQQISIGEEWPLQDLHFSDCLGARELQCLIVWSKVCVFPTCASGECKTWMIKIFAEKRRGLMKAALN